MIDIEQYKQEQALEERMFVSDELLEALDMLAHRHGMDIECLRDEHEPLDVSTGYTENDVRIDVSFMGRYERQDDGKLCFMYELEKDEVVAKDFMELSKSQQLAILELLEGSSPDCGVERAQALLGLIQAYADPEQEAIDELPCRYHYTFECVADDLSNALTISRTIGTYLDGVCISKVTTRAAEAEEATGDDEIEPDDATDTLLLTPEEEMAGELMTATHYDLDELRDMLRRLGLRTRQ